MKVKVIIRLLMKSCNEDLYLLVPLVKQLDNTFNVYGRTIKSALKLFNFNLSTNIKLEMQLLIRQDNFHLHTRKRFTGREVTQIKKI